LSRLGNLQLNQSAVWTAAAANPSYVPEDNNSLQQHKQQQWQRPQQLVGDSGVQPPPAQVNGQQQKYEQQQQQGQQQQQQGQHKQSRWQKVQGMLQQYGPGAFFSYITCSNVLSVTMLSSAWLLFTRTTGYTPLQVNRATSY
jgi:hypothetical protein